MSTLRIRNVGPIVDTGNMAIAPVTILCGPQGIGKSTIAKVLSVCSWIEKAIMRRQLKDTDVTRYSHFVKRYCAYHSLEAYFRSDSEIEYDGTGITLQYSEGKTSISRSAPGGYVMPQICYIPAERNLLLAIENAEKIRRLPAALDNLMTEYQFALQHANLSTPLPVDGTFTMTYDKLNRVSWLHGEGFRVRTHEAASGFQSLIPLILVTRYLSRQVSEATQSPMSVEERERLHREIRGILTNPGLTPEVRSQLINELNAGLKNERFINIVEEPEQNLYPSSQETVLYELLAEYRRSPHNQLLITTHSPYILNALSLAVKAHELLQPTEANEALRARLNAIVPVDSAVPASDIAIYQLHPDGQTELLPMPYGLPSDNNFLNNSIERSNRQFDQLLQLEDEVVDQ